MSGLTLLSCSTTLWIIAKLADYFICFLILNEKSNLSNSDLHAAICILRVALIHVMIDTGTESYKR